jgi:hypothetical protein
LIVDTPDAFRDALAGGAFAPRHRATARGALLVSPVGFRLAEDSASDNRYMRLEENVSEERAVLEHARLAAALGSSLPVITLPGSAETPDAVFPNNVFATVSGKLIVGSMRHPTRRREASRPEVPALFSELFGYRVERIPPEAIAELTGPLVIDRARNIGYCGLTERCDRAGAEAMHAAFGLDLTFVFDLVPSEYHTNVVMAVLAGRALVVHEGSFAEPEVPRAIAEVYGDRVIWLSEEEKGAFAGNCIALSDSEVWMSDHAAARLSDMHRADLERWGFAVRSVELAEIEKAGGSLRCCVAEIF